jgi:hypothetical protein
MKYWYMDTPQLVGDVNQRASSAGGRYGIIKKAEMQRKVNNTISGISINSLMQNPS